jgi:hypothetical protein
MDILYVKRKFDRWSFGREVRRHLFFYEQEGYFLASLYQAFDSITEMHTKQAFDKLEQKPHRFDLVIVNRKSAVLPGMKKDKTLRNIATQFSGPTVLLDAADNASDIASNDVFNKYDLVFKREVFKDRNQYDLSDENKNKMRTTMLPCLQVPLRRTSLAKLLEPIFIPKAPKLDQPEKKWDVFFCGNMATRKTGRIKAVQALKGMNDVNFYGGLQPKNNQINLPENLKFPRMKPIEYARAFQRSKIALALDGLGQFTFRHLEAWYFGEFLLSSPSIRDLQLPLSAEEGKHYIAYDDIDDLKGKVKYYKENKEEREKIAEAGKKMFREEYDPQKHGKHIQLEIQRLL